MQQFAPQQMMQQPPPPPLASYSSGQGFAPGGFNLPMSGAGGQPLMDGSGMMPQPTQPMGFPSGQAPFSS